MLKHSSDTTTRETAGDIRKYAATAAAASKPLISALLGTPYATTSKIKALTTTRATENELFSRLLGAMGGGYTGMSEALTDGWIKQFTGHSPSDTIDNMGPLPKALAIAAATTLGAATGARVGGASSALKYLAIDKLQPTLEKHPDYLSLLLRSSKV